MVLFRKDVRVFEEYFCHCVGVVIKCCIVKVVERVRSLS